MQTSTSTIAALLMMDKGSPLMKPVNRFKSQPMTTMAAMPPAMTMAGICLNRFFIARLCLARSHRAPHHRDALRAGKLAQGLRRRQPKQGTLGVALDNKGAGAGAVRRGEGHRKPLHI